MLKILKVLVFAVVALSLSGCASLGIGKDDNPNQLEKSPCACGEIYNSELDNA